MTFCELEDLLDAAEPQPPHDIAGWVAIIAGGGIVVVVLWIIQAM
jgi:hypothetical protein